MLFLFDNTLTHYIYIVFYTLINRENLAHNLGNYYAMSRHATPSPHHRHNLSSSTPWAATPRTTPRAHNNRHAIANDLSSFTPWATTTPNDIRAHKDRHTIANEPGNLHTHEQPHPTPGRTVAPTEACFRISPVKSRLLIDTGQLLRAAVAFFRSRFAQNHNLL